MEKRRLSSVPCDEATQDMLDMARLFKTMRHVVTARLIENGGVLLLNFYKTTDLRSGKTAASFRTFILKDDYITQDLKRQKVKWLTSSFERMDDFEIFSLHWNGSNCVKKQRVYIRSEEEAQLIGDFLSEYKKDRDGQARSIEPWDTVINFQNKVMDKRLAERHKKELIAVDAVMNPIKEVPSEFSRWVWDVGMRFSRYVIYKETAPGVAECECTHCGNIGLVSRKDVRLRNNEKGECPFCGSMVTFKARGRMPARILDERWFVYVDPTSDGFVLRYYKAFRTIRSDSYIRSSFEKKRVEDIFHEYNRTICTFQNGKMITKDYDWAVYKQKGKPRWCPAVNGNSKFDCGFCILYPENLPHAWQHTPLKYSALEILAANMPTVSIRYEKGMNRYLVFPKLEWICKMGLNNLAKHIIENGDYSNRARINFNGKTIYDILGIDKINTRVLQAVDGGDVELRLLQAAQKIGLRFKPDQLKEYSETFGCNTDLLNQAGRKVSLHKLVKYITKESMNYPMGDAGRCHAYSYNRYIEREDPRIERKRNTANDWIEYLKWCAELNYDIDNMFIYMPSNFKKVHDRTAKEYQAAQDKIEAEKKKRMEREAARKMAQTKKAIEDIFTKNEDADAFAIKGSGLILVVPKSGEEIKAEGEALHHCVGGYVKRVAEGRTNIFFVRKAAEPDKPYFTMEWNNNQVVQCRGSHNCGMPPEVKAFVKVFEQKMQGAIKKCS